VYTFYFHELTFQKIFLFFFSAGEEKLEMKVFPQNPSFRNILNP